MDFERLFSSIDDADALRRRSVFEEQTGTELGYDPLFYRGRDPVTGKVRTQLRSVPMLSNVQPELGESGIGAGGFDLGSRASRVERKTVSVVDVKILATCVFNGRRRFYIGGDRPSSREIFDVDAQEQIGLVSLQNKGSGINEWTLGLATFSEGNYRIYTVFGDGSASWSVTDGKVRTLVYYGEGFWSGFFGAPDELKDERYLEEQFMDYQGSQVKAFAITPDGPGSVSAATTDSGIVQDPSPWVYTGTKTRIYRTSAARELASDNYTLQGIDNQERERIIETQCPTYRAYNGSFTYVSGSYRYRAFDRRQAFYSRGPISLGVYPSYYLPSLPDPPNGEQQQSLSVDTTIAIAPTLNKRITLEYPGTAGPNVNLAGDLTQYYPVAVFGTKAIYRSLVGLGRSLDDSVLAQTKFFLAGLADVEVFFPQGLPQTFIDTGASLPTARSIDIGTALADSAIASRLSCNILTIAPQVPTYDFANAQTKSVRAFRVVLPSSIEASVLGIY